MHPDVRNILKLQNLDHEIRALQEEIGRLPKRLAEIEKQLEAHLRTLEANKAALAASQRERKRLELAVQEQEQKISRLKGQMMEARTNEQYRAFQHEIAHCEEEIRKHEDRILELMESSEQLESEVIEAERQLEAERRQVETEKGQIRNRTAEDQKRLAAAEAAKGALMSQIPSALATAYERLRKKHKNGLAVVEVNSAGVCMGCMLALRPQYFQDLKRMEAVVFCENCGRFIFFEPPAEAVDPVAG